MATWNTPSGKHPMIDQDASAVRAIGIMCITCYYPDVAVGNGYCGPHRYAPGDRFPEIGDRVRDVKADHEGTVTDVVDTEDPDAPEISVSWDGAESGVYGHERIEIINLLGRV